MAALPMRLRCAAIAAALAVATVLSGDPLAYVANGPTWGQPQMSYRINSSNLDLSAAGAIAAVRAGAAAWQQQSGAFRFNYAGSSTQSTTTNDGVNLVLFRNAQNGSAVASTYWWSNGS